MITTTIEFVCDSCKTVISSVGPYDKPADVVMVVAESLARSHGAQINVASVTCADCRLKELTMPNLEEVRLPSIPTIDQIADSINPTTT